MKRALLATFAAALLAGCVTDKQFRQNYGIGTVVMQSQRRGFADALAEHLQQATRGAVINFADFSDFDFRAVTDSVANEEGVTIWQGRVSDARFFGNAIAVVEGGHVVGSLQIDDHVYSIRTKLDDLVVTEVDETMFPDESEPRLPQLRETPMTRTPSPFPRPTEGAPVKLRVLLVVPPQLSKWCSPSMSRLMAEMSEASVDGVWSRFTGGAIGAEMSVYCTAHEASGDLYPDLDWVMNDAGVKAQRAATKSNMVAFIVPEASSCGQSYANYPVDDPEASTRAFSVVRFDCAWENYSLAHELGHQLGMDHDRYTIKGGYLDRCNYGYSFIKDGKPVARDVMAYSGYCKSILGADCPRIGTYSFATTISGVQMGVPCSVTGDTDPMTGAASNVEQLLVAAPVAATWQ